jgi:hypothetical protein
VLSASVLAGGKPHELYYRITSGPIADGADSLLIASLLPAMRWDMPLHSTWPVSPRLQRSIPKIQDIFHAWDRNFREVSVDVAVRESGSERKGPGATAAFFSGGVDSFYTALKNHAEITALVLVRGFDIPLDAPALWQDVSTSVREAARRLGKRLIEVETNLGLFSSKYVSWALYHGSALASVATLLSPQFSRFFIPSTHSYLHLFPWGSHALVDPLWTTEDVEIVHDGAEAGRMDKVRTLAANDIFLDHLRVCWENKNGEYNCGKCEKCLRTMVSLYISGALGRCRTFTEPLRLDRVARVRAVDPNVRSFVEENLDAAERWNQDPRLVRALRVSLGGRYYRGRWRTLRGRLLSIARNRWNRHVRPRWNAAFGRAARAR